MRISESCENWQMKFDFDNEIEITEEQLECFKGILHTAGDTVAVVLGIPSDQEDLRNEILRLVTALFLDARSKIQMAVEYAIMESSIKAPLESGFTNEELFGEDLVETLKASLTEDESTVADEYLKEDEDDEESEENDHS